MHAPYCKHIPSLLDLDGDIGGVNVAVRLFLVGDGENDTLFDMIAIQYVFNE